MMFLSYIFLIVLLSQVKANDTTLQVKLEDGTVVQGHKTIKGTSQWQGISYAKPPLGDLRFEYPTKPDPITDHVYEANFLAPGCSQVCNLPDGSCSTSGYSEDCLYLTVNAPSSDDTPPEGGYPVFFWMHGGAYSQGLGDSDLYDGTKLAEQKVVNVIINYRLGAIGFMASKSMSGNYGFMDQIQALKWTRSNIAGFNGNPDKITIAGQSAGGESVGTFITSPETKGLFSKAIMQSNPLALPMHTRDSATKNANDVFEYCGCAIDDVECMRKVPADKIVEAQTAAVEVDMKNLFINFLPFAPLVDPTGPLPKQPFYVFQSGDFNPVPILSGHVKEEGWLFVNELFTDSMKKIEYKAILNVLFGFKASRQVLEKYPYDLLDENEKDGRNPLSVLGTDLLFLCPLRNITRSYQAAQGANTKQTYIYRFMHTIQEDVWEPSNPYCVGYVCHGSELPFVFDSWIAGDIHYDITDDEKQLTKDTQNAWVNWIYNGNPNGDNIPAPGYPLYDGQSDMIALMESPGFTNEAHTRSDYCDMWDSMGYFY
jgi:acetylcholinesterase/cholinesterase